MLKSAVGHARVGGPASPWREVLRPHDDVATGNFQAAEFAADLYKVAATSEDAGKRLRRARSSSSRAPTSPRACATSSAAPCGACPATSNASPVINLQTNFGGGKTHSMLALWHLAAGRRSATTRRTPGAAGRERLRRAAREVRRVALVGNHISPSGSVKADGTQVNTIWGELAWQLGGTEALRDGRDRPTPTAPHPGEALHDAARCLRPGGDPDRRVGRLRAQPRRPRRPRRRHASTTSSPSPSRSPRRSRARQACCSRSRSPHRRAATTPQPVAGNAEEVGGAHGLEALKRLQNVVRRVADQWRPASSDEAYHIVRQRLFVAPDADALAAIGATARGVRRDVPQARRRLPARGARRRLRGPDQADLPDPPRAVRPPLRGLVEPRALPAHPRRAAPDEHRHPRAVGRRGPVAADHARRRSRSRPRR